MDHVGVVVGDLEAAKAFFVALGLEAQGDMTVEGRDVDRIVGLEDVRCDVAFVSTPDGHSSLELIRFRSPPVHGQGVPAPANTAGLRHITFAVDDIEATLERLREQGGDLVGELVDYGGSYRLCYVRGPEGIIVELAEKLG
jgi:catechol 2,3-dioxygenase-like lactoylglutathione lyase family enzyme